MKRTLLILVILIGFSAVNLSAWDPNDLTKFPSCTKANDWILNLGVGLDSDWVDSIGEDYYYLPTFRLSFDKNVALGDGKLPFFFGGIVGYFGYGYDGKGPNWHHHRIPAGFRVGYHFNWGVDNLDTYAVITSGYIFGFSDSKHFKYRARFRDDFYTNINIGVRYFLNKGFGFWAETGFGSIFNPRFGFDLGLAFKF